MRLGYYSHMATRAVSIAELKNKLSAYLAEVRRGEEFVVNDRRLPIARIVPLPRSPAIDDEAVALAAEGKLRLPERPLTASFWRMRAPKVDKGRLLEALRAEREED
jgi:prevent-host-death family protein